MAGIGGVEAPFDPGSIVILYNEKMVATLLQKCVINLNFVLSQRPERILDE